MPLDESERLALSLAQAVGLQAAEGWEKLYRDSDEENKRLKKEVQRLQEVERMWEAHCRVVKMAQDYNRGIGPVPTDECGIVSCYEFP